MTKDMQRIFKEEATQSLASKTAASATLLCRGTRINSKLFSLSVLLFQLACGVSSPYRSKSVGIKQPNQVKAEKVNKIEQSSIKKNKFIYADLEEIQALDIKKVFGSYLGQGARWVVGKPIVVNHEFDFEIAMAMPAVGAGLADNKRSKANAHVALKLATIGELNLKSNFESTVRECKKECQDVEFCLYGLLFLNKRGRLQTVLDILQKETDSDLSKERTQLRIVYISDSKTVEGKGSWTHRATLKSAMEEAAEALGDLYREYTKGSFTVNSADLLGESVPRCPVGGNQYIIGTSIQEQEDRVILLVKEDPITLVSCDKSSISE